MPSNIIPATPLKPGDKILVLASAWMFGDGYPFKRIEEMKKIILDMEFTPVVPDNIVPQDGQPYNYDYAQSPKIRASHYSKYLHKDSDIKAVWFVNGGVMRSSKNTSTTLPNDSKP